MTTFNSLSYLWVHVSLLTIFLHYISLFILLPLFFPLMCWCLCASLFCIKFYLAPRAIEEMLEVRLLVWNNIIPALTAPPLFPHVAAATVPCSLKSFQWNFASLFIMSGVDVEWIQDIIHLWYAQYNFTPFTIIFAIQLGEIYMTITTFSFALMPITWWLALVAVFKK